MRTSLAVALLLAVPAVASAQGQDPYLELLRSDIKTQRVAILTEVLDLTEDQGQLFWPIYREYELETSKLGDRTVSLLTEYVESYDSGMTAEQAKSIADQWFKIQDDKLKLKKKYFRRVEKDLGSLLAARFLQVENQVGLLMDLQIAQSLPLIE